MTSFARCAQCKSRHHASLSCVCPVNPSRRTVMKAIKHLALASVLPALFACSDSSDRTVSTPPAPQPEPPPALEPAQLRVTHASPDAPDVNVYVNGDLALEAVPFRASSGLLTIADPGALEVEVRALLPDASEVS